MCSVCSVIGTPHTVVSNKGQIKFELVRVSAQNVIQRKYICCDIVFWPPRVHRENKNTINLKIVSNAITTPKNVTECVQEPYRLRH